MKKRWPLFLLLATSLVSAQKTAPHLVLPESRESDAQYSRLSGRGRERIAVIVQYAEGTLAGGEREGGFERETVTRRRESRGRLVNSLERPDAEIVEVTRQELQALEADETVTCVSPANREVSG